MLAKTKKHSTRYRVKRGRGPDSSTVTHTGSWRSVRTRRAVTKKLPRKGDKVAAGPGFEPRLSDSESVSIPSPLFTTVQNSPVLGRIPGADVSRCSSLF